MSENANWHGGNRIKRLMQTLWLLPGPAVWTRQALADHFGISPRTVLRDIQLLRESGLSIDIDDQTGGYTLAATQVRGGELVPLELLALALAPELLKLPDLHFLRLSWQTAIGKLFASLAPAKRTGIQHAVMQIQNLADDRRQEEVGRTTEEGPLFGDLSEHSVMELVEYWMDSKTRAPGPRPALPQSLEMRQ